MLRTGVGTWPPSPLTAEDRVWITGIQSVANDAHADAATADGKAVSAQTTANAAMPKAGGNFTGDVTMDAGKTIDGHDLSNELPTMVTATGNAQTTANTANAKADGLILRESGRRFDVTRFLFPTSDAPGGVLTGGSLQVDPANTSSPNVIALDDAGAARRPLSEVLEVPAGATSLVVRGRGRAQTAPGAPAAVGIQVWIRKMGAAGWPAPPGTWTGPTTVAALPIGTTIALVSWTATVALGTLSLAVGDMLQLTVGRAAGGLAGNYLLTDFEATWS